MAAFPGGPPRDAIMPEGAEPTRWSPYGFTLAGGDPAPLVADGVAAVQDEASQLAAIALATVPLDGPDRLWLDMCAGPGGKARLAEEAGAQLIAADLHEHRAALVRDALARTPRHGSGTAVITADGRRPPWPEAALDRVLLREAKALRAEGKHVTIVTPGPRDLAVMGANLMDPRRRPDVLEVSLRTSADSLATLDRVSSRAA